MAEAMGQEAGVPEVRRSQEWNASAQLQPTIRKADSLLVPVATGLRMVSTACVIGVDALTAQYGDHPLLALDQ